MEVQKSHIKNESPPQEESHVWKDHTERGDSHLSRLKDVTGSKVEEVISYDFEQGNNYRTHNILISAEHLTKSKTLKSKIQLSKASHSYKNQYFNENQTHKESGISSQQANIYHRAHQDHVINLHPLSTTNGFYPKRNGHTREVQSRSGNGNASRGFRTDNSNFWKQKNEIIRQNKLEPLKQNHQGYDNQACGPKTGKIYAQSLSKYKQNGNVGKTSHNDGSDFNSHDKASKNNNNKGNDSYKELYQNGSAGVTTHEENQRRQKILQQKHPNYVFTDSVRNNYGGNRNDQTIHNGQRFKKPGKFHAQQHSNENYFNRHQSPELNPKNKTNSEEVSRKNLLTAARPPKSKVDLQHDSSIRNNRNTEGSDHNRTSKQLENGSVEMKTLPKLKDQQGFTADKDKQQGEQQLKKEKSFDNFNAVPDSYQGRSRSVSSTRKRKNQMLREDRSNLRQSRFKKNQHIPKANNQNEGSSTPLHGTRDREKQEEIQKDYDLYLKILEEKNKLRDEEEIKKLEEQAHYEEMKKKKFSNVVEQNEHIDRLLNGRKRGSKETHSFMSAKKGYQFNSYLGKKVKEGVQQDQKHRGRHNDDSNNGGSSDEDYDNKKKTARRKKKFARKSMEDKGHKTKNWREAEKDKQQSKAHGKKTSKTAQRKNKNWKDAQKDERKKKINNRRSKGDDSSEISGSDQDGSNRTSEIDEDARSNLSKNRSQFGSEGEGSRKSQKCLIDQEKKNNKKSKMQQTVISKKRVVKPKENSLQLKSNQSNLLEQGKLDDTVNKHGKKTSRIGGQGESPDNNEANKTYNLSKFQQSKLNQTIAFEAVNKDRSNYDRAPILSFIYNLSRFFEVQDCFDASISPYTYDKVIVPSSAHSPTENLYAFGIAMMLQIDPWIIDRIIEPFLSLDKKIGIWLFRGGVWKLNEVKPQKDVFSTLEALLKKLIRKDATLQEIISTLSGHRSMVLKQGKKLFKEIEYNCKKRNMIKAFVKESAYLKDKVYDVIKVESTPIGENVIQIKSKDKDHIWVKEEKFNQIFDFFLLLSYRPCTYWTYQQLAKQATQKSVFMIESSQQTLGSIGVHYEGVTKCKIHFYKEIEPKVLKLVGNISENNTNSNKLSFQFNVKGTYYLFVQCQETSIVSVESSSKVKIDFIEQVSKENLKNDQCHYVQIDRVLKKNLKEWNMKGYKQNFIDFLTKNH